MLELETILHLLHHRNTYEKEHYFEHLTDISCFFQCRRFTEIDVQARVVDNEEVEEVADESFAYTPPIWYHLKKTPNKPSRRQYIESLRLSYGTAVSVVTHITHYPSKQAQIKRSKIS